MSCLRLGSAKLVRNVVTGSSNVEVIAGYQNVVGFGWANAVYLELERLLHSSPQRPR